MISIIQVYLLPDLKYPPFLSDIVALVANNSGVPHIEFDVADEEHMEEKPNHQMTLNMYPSQLILSKAYADIVHNFGWRKFTIVYDADDGKWPISDSTHSSTN